MTMGERGFSLLEVMTVITVIALLTVIGYPSFVNVIRESNRAEARAQLLDWANRQEAWRADNISYSTDFDPADTERYVYSVIATDDTFTLTATANGPQSGDSEGDISCATLTLTHDYIRGPAGHESCWIQY